MGRDRQGPDEQNEELPPDQYQARASRPRAKREMRAHDQYGNEYEELLPPARRSRERYEEPPARRSRERYEEELYADPDLIEYPDEYPDEYEPRTRRRSAPQRTSQRSQRTRPPSIEAPVPRRRRRQRRNVWPLMLTGCAIGVVLAILAATVVIVIFFRASQGAPLPSLPGLVGSKPFSKAENTTVPLTALSQIQVCDRVGNVTLKVDPTVTQTTISAKKTVYASSQSDADQQFRRFTVEVQPPGTITQPQACVRPQSTSAGSTDANATPTATSQTTSTRTATPLPTASGSPGSPSGVATTNPAALLVNVVFPTGDNPNNTVDLLILLPRSILPSDNPSMQVNVEAPRNIMVDGLSGVLHIKGGIGKVSVQHSVLADGSRLNALGDVSFDGFLDIPPDALTPPNFIIQSEQRIDATLPENTNVKLSANTNAGTIKSDFNIVVNNSNNPVSYNGPLNPALNRPPAATLVLDVGTGNVYIHKSQI